MNIRKLSLIGVALAILLAGAALYASDAAKSASQPQVTGQLSCSGGCGGDNATGPCATKPTCPKPAATATPAAKPAKCDGHCEGKCDGSCDSKCDGNCDDCTAPCPNAGAAKIGAKPAAGGCPMKHGAAKPACPKSGDCQNCDKACPKPSAAPTSAAKVDPAADVTKL